MRHPKVTHKHRENASLSKAKQGPKQLTNLHHNEHRNLVEAIRNFGSHGIE